VHFHLTTLPGCKLSLQFDDVGDGDFTDIVYRGYLADPDAGVLFHGHGAGHELRVAVNPQNMLAGNFVAEFSCCAETGYGLQEFSLISLGEADQGVYCPGSIHSSNGGQYYSRNSKGI